MDLHKWRKVLFESTVVAESVGYPPTARNKERSSPVGFFPPPPPRLSARARLYRRLRRPARLVCAPQRRQARAPRMRAVGYASVGDESDEPTRWGMGGEQLSIVERIVGSSLQLNVDFAFQGWKYCKNTTNMSKI